MLLDWADIELAVLLMAAKCTAVRTACASASAAVSAAFTSAAVCTPSTGADVRTASAAAALLFPNQENYLLELCVAPRNHPATILLQLLPHCRSLLFAASPSFTSFPTPHPFSSRCSLSSQLCASVSDTQPTISRALVGPNPAVPPAVPRKHGVPSNTSALITSGCGLIRARTGLRTPPRCSPPRCPCR